MKLTVTKDSLIGDILKADPTTEPCFLEMGMFCMGCSSAAEESLEDACFVHGISAEALIEKLNNHITP